MRTIEKLERAFLLYETLKRRADYCQEQRGSRHGISVCDDHYAKEYQKLEFRIHFLRCYLSGEKLNWYLARWVSNEEAERRNNGNAPQHEHRYQE